MFTFAEQVWLIMSDSQSSNSNWLLTGKRLLRFTQRVIANFLQNRGILLAGGVGYNILLSIIPLFALLCVLLTHIVDEQQLLDIIAIQAGHLAPAYSNVILESVRGLLESRDLVSWTGIIALLFFSSFAFRMLEDSIAIIFHQPEDPVTRNVWLSVLLPYIFMLVLGAALLILTLLVSAAHGLNELTLASFDRQLPLAGASGVLLNLLGFVGMFVLFSAIYKVMPVIKIAKRRALIGGFVAALLWEVVRWALEYYFLNISFVSSVYGSLATLIVLLIGLEVGAGILLFGAQVIAELEFNARAQLPWYSCIDRRRASYRSIISTIS